MLPAGHVLLDLESTKVKEVTLHRVVTPTQALAAALIRNECCQWMTGNSRKRSVGSQLKWFSAKPANLDLYLVFDGETVNPVGYAVIQLKGGTWKDGAWWLTGGIAAHKRGQGYGKALFQYLIAACGMGVNGDIWLSVLKTNRRAISLYKKLNFVTKKTTKRLFVMQYDPTA